MSGQQYEEGFDPPLPVLADRLRGLLRSMGDVTKRLRAVETAQIEHASRIEHNESDLREVIDELKSIKRIGIGILLSAVGGSTSITIAVLASTGGIHL